MNNDFFFYKGKNIGSIGFLGIGKSNTALYEYLIARFPYLSVTVRSSQRICDNSISYDRCFFDEECLSDITEDILFLSPSARRDAPELFSAVARGTILSSDTEFFFSISKNPVFAITGSDGKSTTTALTARLLSQSYDKAIPCANFGEPLAPHLEDSGKVAFVAELSSFQLMYQAPSSQRCLITNISKNHLNWHKSFDEYINAKSNILINARERVLNYDSEISRKLLRDYETHTVYSTKLSETELRSRVKAKTYLSLDGGFIKADGRNILDTRDIKLNGKHNVINFMAAIALSYGFCDSEHIKEVARGFCGLEHRCEYVMMLDGVDYYNSSIDSSPKRCKNTLSMMKKRVIPILGGRSKGLDFSELIPILKNKARAVVLTGECRDEIEAILTADKSFLKSGIKILKVADFYDAIERARELAVFGDAVILSPAATSYDRFKNFEERGCAFKEYIRNLKPKGF